MAPDPILHLNDATVNPRVAEPAAFLLELAGQGGDRNGRPNHIVMCDEPRGDKYLTIHRHLTLADIRDHLSGVRTVGGYLTRPENKVLCRTVGFDSDGPEPFSRLVAAAPVLLASGARPILESTPAGVTGEHAGGGKLWLVFDAPVVWAEAVATVLGHAPALRGLERFPPGRVRLPGGLYRKGVNEWCEFQAFGAADDNWYTGELAIRTMMEWLTPAGWVRPGLGAQTRERQIGPDELIVSGIRNVKLFRMGCSMRRAGFDEEAILAALLSTNERRCEPPLDDRELEKIAASASRYVPEPPGAYSAQHPAWAGRLKVAGNRS